MFGYLIWLGIILAIAAMIISATTWSRSRILSILSMVVAVLAIAYILHLTSSTMVLGPTH